MPKVRRLSTNISMVKRYHGRLPLPQRLNLRSAGVRLPLEIRSFFRRSSILCIGNARLLVNSSERLVNSLRYFLSIEAFMNCILHRCGHSIPPSWSLTLSHASFHNTCQFSFKSHLNCWRTGESSNRGPISKSGKIFDFGSKDSYKTGKIESK